MARRLARLERRVNALTAEARAGFAEARQERTEMNRILHQRMDNLPDTVQTSFDEVRPDLALTQKANERVHIMENALARRSTEYGTHAVAANG